MRITELKRKLEISQNISIFLVLVILIFISFLFFRKVSMFLLISILVGIFTYLNYYFRLPFDISPVLFISLVFSREYSFFFSTVFILISGVFPMIIAGGSFDHTTIFYVSVRVAINYLNSLLVSFPAAQIFLFMIVFDHLIGSAGSVFLFGNQPLKEITNFFIQVAVDIFYIFSFSALLVNLIS